MWKHVWTQKPFRKTIEEFSVSERSLHFEDICSLQFLTSGYFRPEVKISGFPLDGLFLIMYKISARRITLLSEGQTKQKIKQDKKPKTKQHETKNHCLHWVKLNI